MADDPVEEDTNLDGSSSGAEIVFAITAAFLCAILIRTVSSMVPYKFRFLPIPYTAAMLIVGVICGAMVSNGATVEYMSSGLLQFESISPSVLFAIFLPALIVPSGFGLKWHTVEQVLWKALSMAVFGTLINCGLIAIVAYYVLPYDWEWSQSWLFAAILSATDPVAVVAIMQASGSDPRLTTIVEGESLLNDGVAYVMFEIFLGWALGEPVEAGSTVGFVFKASLGGPALGLAWALALMIWLQILFNDALSEITLSITAAYSLWVLCDDVLGVSGVLALVFFSVAIGAIGKNHISRSSAHNFKFIWEWIDWVANTLIFFLAGLIIAAEISRKSNDINGQDWGYTFALFFLLLVIRFISIVILYPILAYGRYGVQLKDVIILTWSGLRGAVGLTLSLIVYNSTEFEDEQFKLLVFFHVAMMAVLTLLLQGSTTSLLLKALGYTRMSPTKRHIMFGSAHLIEKLGEQELQREKDSASLLGDADWDKVKALTRVTLKEIINIRGSRKKRTRFGRRQKTFARQTEESQDKTEDDTLNIHQKDLLTDLRERLLKAVLSNYQYAFSQEFLTPLEVMKLSNSVENSLDCVDSHLADWEDLYRRLDGHPPSQSKNKIKNLVKGAFYRTIDFIQRKEGPLLGTVSRSSALAFTFCCSHAAARRYLKTFVEAELGLSQGEIRLSDDRNGSMLARVSTDLEKARLSKEDELEPYWEEGEDLHVQQEERNLKHGRLPKSHQSLVRHMATEDLLIVEDIQHILHKVLQESRREQSAAEDYLHNLLLRNPKEMKDCRSEFLAVSLLRKQTEMLRLFLKEGLLDSKEVEFSLSIIESRMKRLHGHYHIK